ncbi:MAG: glycosyl hydrolase, partial [Muribaculaceae bacterium]|nr:glycosyl hydrolase [Muribaculaceae bacterium]
MKKIAILCCMLACLVMSAKDLKDNFNGKYAPANVGNKVCERFIEVPHPNWGADTTPTREITYPETCAWLGALRYAKA